MMYPISEVFWGLQGEGEWTGQPALFVRFAGCNLRCEFCDTDFAPRLHVDADGLCDLCRQVLQCAEVPMKSMDTLHVVVTGGEPLLFLDQPAFDALASAVSPRPMLLHVETNGTVAPGVDLRDAWVTWSPKSELTLPAVPWVSEVKLVWPGPVSIPFVLEHEPAGVAHHWLQPCDPGDRMGLLANTKEALRAAAMNSGWRVSFQGHKLSGMR